MLRAIGISKYIFRGFASLQQLVANPKKLQKRMTIPKTTRWLHKDVKVGTKRPPKTISEEELDSLARRSVSSTLGTSSSDSLQNFCAECINRLGAESFSTFITKHEMTITKLIYLPHYKAYLRSCFKYFKNDLHLLQLLSFCDFRQLNTDSIPKLVKEESFDNETQIDFKSHYYMKMMPKSRYLFDDYSVYTPVAPAPINQIYPVYLSESDIPHTDSDLRPSASLIKSPDKKLVLDRIMTFSQTHSKPPRASNWIYLQVDLGKDEMLSNKNIFKTFERIGVKVFKDIRLFHNTPTVESDIFEIDNQLKAVDIQTSKEIDIQSVSELAKSSRTSVIKQSGNEDEMLSGELSTNSSEHDRDNKRFNEMIKFSSRISAKNKAYGFIELESNEAKQKMLNVYFRLFGIEMEKALLVVEDADIKKTLRVSNLPWNLDPAEFINWVNRIIEEEGLSMAFDVDTQFKNYLSDASYIFINANSFGETLELFEIINKHEYKGRKVYAEFRRGCGRFISGQIMENYYSASREEKEKAHIDRRTKQKEAWSKRYSGSD